MRFHNPLCDAQTGSAAQSLARLRRENVVASEAADLYRLCDNWMQATDITPFSFVNQSLANLVSYCVMPQPLGTSTVCASLGRTRQAVLREGGWRLRPLVLPFAAQEVV
jgi:hypothetical protein